MFKVFTFFLLLLTQPAAFPTTNLHTTWLWHLHQPVYWPDRRISGNDHYEAAWDTVQQQNAGRAHPAPEILNDIFGLADRVAAYQGRPRDALNSILSYPNAGAQLSYSGALIENVQSLAAAGQLGYANGWNTANQQARAWQTSFGKPRLDALNFTYHHALAPLLTDETLEMELRIHKRQMEIFWGTSPPVSRGYFPAETCFTERMIPVLNKVGITWSVVANNHLTRACADFPLALGSGGENCDIPNPADQLNPAQGAGNYKRISIERGCSPSAAMPFAFQVHYARYVDPTTGTNSRVMIVPSDQALGWRDSYNPWDVGLLSDLAARNDPAKPALALFAHDGDNAWSGGYSYYMEWVNNLASQAAGRGYSPTTVEQFLAENPPDANDVVHVEDGGWVFADGDFGSPIFINWHWPPTYASSGVNIVDPSLGTSDKADNWRVIIATENRVKTAQQIAGETPNLDQVRDPWSFSGVPNAVELGWHYYLAGLDSGFVYYGCHHDECQRAVVAQSNAVRNVNGILTGNPAADTTPPTLFPPQRHPWNPGSTNFGNQYGYKVTVAANSDFWVWTYAYDVSGIANVSLKFRLDGTNPPASDQFKTYAGGPLAGAWQTSNMTQRVVSPIIGVTPQYIADYYYAKVSGVTNNFVDYYVTANDSRGNVYNSPIQHVWVGAGQGGGTGGGATNGPGCNGRVCVAPAAPVAASSVTLQFSPAGGPLTSVNPIYVHLGWNNWHPVVSPDGLMTFNAASNRWEYTTTISGSATQLDCAFNNGGATWDNNNNADWHFTVASNSVPQPPAAPQNVTATPVLSNQVNLSWSAAAGAAAYIVNRDASPVTMTTAANYSDTGLTPNAYHCYSIVASNSVGFSTPSATACATTPISYPPFVLDGVVDSPGYLLASNGMTLYAAIRGTKLYVATWSPGTSGSNDHFIFVTDQLLANATSNAPWAKAGKVAFDTTHKPYLASESLSTYISWYNAPSGSQSYKAPASSGQMEGTLDLVASFGSVPTNLYLCAAAYQTADGGALASQAPASTGAAADLDPNEFLPIPTLALRDNNADGLFDRLDPNLDFKIESIRPVPTGYAIQWTAMPGHSYQPSFGVSPSGGWSNLAGAFTTAGPLHLSLTCTDTALPAVIQRFYRIRLSP